MELQSFWQTGHADNANAAATAIATAKSAGGIPLLPMVVDDFSATFARCNN
ncbi:MAG: hypothetical protein ACP5O7_03295 [Phycisphaerae bacterium]